MTRLLICLLLTAIAAIEGHNLESWTEMPGAAVDVSAKGKELWAINSAQQIYRWNNGNWIHIPGAALRVGASPDGWSWVVNSADDIYRFNIDTNSWNHIPGKLVQVNAISKDRAIGVNRAGNIFIWEYGAWKLLPGTAVWAGIGEGDERWVVNSAGNIYRWTGATSDWTQIPGAAANVDAQSADRVIVTNKAGKMYVWRSKTWHELPGECTRATITHEHAYCVNSARNIFKLKVGPHDAKASMGTQNVHGKGLHFEGWTEVPGAAVEISAKGNEVWAINSAQQIYRWNNGGWTHIPGAAVRVGASPDGWSWVVNSVDDIYRFNIGTNSWNHIPGKLVQISAMSKDKALGVNRQGNIFTWENNAWKLQPGQAAWAAIGTDDERWVVNSGGHIFRWTHTTSDWTRVPGVAVSVEAQNASRVIVTNGAGNMFAWQSGAWQLLPGECTRATIAHDHAYCVNSARNIFKSKVSTSKGHHVDQKEMIHVHHKDDSDKQLDEEDGSTQTVWKDIIVYE